MMKFPVYGQTKAMFQTTNQVWSFQYLEMEQTVDLWISDHLESDLAISNSTLQNSLRKPG